MKNVRIVLAGIGGYGAKYVRDLLRGGGEYPYELVGAADPYPDSSPVLADLRERGIPIYSSLEQFYADCGADLAILSSPIQFHCAQTCLALSHGSHVLCEKPVSASVEDARRMIEAREQAQRFVAIGYQWSFSDSVQAFKRDIASGILGRPVRFRTLVLWPRSEQYYARSWAGKLRDTEGNLILDSVANNATAHYIHNMFYVLGRTADESAQPSRIVAETYRANHIENYDTAAMRAHTEDGTELLYYGSHAVNEQVGAQFCYEFEHADVTYDDLDPETGITARFHNGETKLYGNPNQQSDAKLWAAVAAAHDAGPIVCGVEAAMSHTVSIHGMQQSMPEIVPFPEEIVRRSASLPNGEPGVYVEDLVESMKACYERGVLPAESGFSWARPGKEIEL